MWTSSGRSDQAQDETLAMSAKRKVRRVPSRRAFLDDFVALPQPG
jgi:hypothetical protein